MLVSKFIPRKYQLSLNKIWNYSDSKIQTLMKSTEFVLVTHPSHEIISWRFSLTFHVNTILKDSLERFPLQSFWAHHYFPIGLNRGLQACPILRGLSELYERASIDHPFRWLSMTFSWCWYEWVTNIATGATHLSEAILEEKTNIRNP